MGRIYNKKLRIGLLEQVTDETVVFLFHLETGIKKHTVNNYENDEFLNFVKNYAIVNLNQFIKC